MNNRIFDIDLTRVLPPTLKNDETMLALAKVIAAQLQENSRLARLNIIYARIDELPENVIDILAYDLHVDWYDTAYPVEVKRKVLKDSVKIHKYMGTKYAVETALGNVYQDSKVAEWFEYGGKPFYFKVIVDITQSGEIITEEKQRDIYKKVFFYKNLRSHLEGIEYKANAGKGRLILGAYPSAGVQITVHPYISPSINERADITAGAFIRTGLKVKVG